MRVRHLTRVLIALLAAWGATHVAAADIDLKPCRLRGVQHPALCGQLKRPLDPAAATPVLIDVHVAVLPALARNKRPDPVFFLAGGPGQSAIDLAGPVGRLLGRFSNRRDIVLIDQRGTGRSAPLVCEGDETADRPLQDAVDPAQQVALLARCREALQGLPHGDLRRYTTTLAMQDAEAVRQALGVERINLVGVSYGTRAALTYLRLYPGAVRRVVLDGVAPPDMVLPQSFGVDAQAALDALLVWCRGDAACQRRHPQLAQQWAGLRAALPRNVTLTHPLNGREETVRMTVDVLAAMVRAPLYSPVLAAALPLAIEEAAAGRWSPLAGLAVALSSSARGPGLAQGMHFSVVCAEDLPLKAGHAAPPAAPPATEFGNLSAVYAQVCRDWPRGEVDAAFYQVPVSASPVLLLSGAIDPVTPPRHAERMAKALGGRARHVVVPNAGHGVMGQGCLRDVVYRFVDQPDDAASLAVDAGCSAQVPRPVLFDGVRPRAAR